MAWYMLPRTARSLAGRIAWENNGLRPYNIGCCAQCSFYSTAPPSPRAAFNVVQSRKATSQKKRHNKLLATIAGLGVFGGVIFSPRNEGDDETSSGVRNSLRLRFWGLFDKAASAAMGPGREKLLPDFPIQHLPPGCVAPRTLVLDLEGTLTREEWSPEYGWRTAKRPGLDVFLRRMANVYEIVLFSEGGYAMTEPVAYQIDPFQCISHRLYRDSARFVRGHYLKDLSLLNRDLRRVVAIDNDPSAIRLHRQNGIVVKSFEDAEPGSAVKPGDTTLRDLVPFLEAIVERDVLDVRVFIGRYKDIARGKSSFSKSGGSPAPVLSHDVTAAFHKSGENANRQSASATGLSGVVRSFRGQWGT